MGTEVLILKLSRIVHISNAKENQAVISEKFFYFFIHSVTAHRMQFNETSCLTSTTIFSTLSCVAEQYIFESWN